MGYNHTLISSFEKNYKLFIKYILLSSCIVLLTTLGAGFYQVQKQAFKEAYRFINNSDYQLKKELDIYARFLSNIAFQIKNKRLTNRPEEIRNLIIKHKKLLSEETGIKLINGSIKWYGNEPYSYEIDQYGYKTKSVNYEKGFNFAGLSVNKITNKLTKEESYVMCLSTKEDGSKLYLGDICLQFYLENVINNISKSNKLKFLTLTEYEEEYSDNAISSNNKGEVFQLKSFNGEVKVIRKIDNYLLFRSYIKSAFIIIISIMLFCIISVIILALFKYKMLKENGEKDKYFEVLKISGSAINALWYSLYVNEVKTISFLKKKIKNIINTCDVTKIFTYDHPSGDKIEGYLAKLELEEFYTRITEINTDKLIGDTLEILSKITFEKKVTINKTILKDGNFYFEELNLKRIILSLIYESLSQIQKSGIININIIHKKDKTLQLNISDNSFGVPLEKVNKEKALKGLISDKLQIENLIKLYGGEIHTITKIGDGRTIKLSLPSIERLPDKDYNNKFNSNVVPIR